MTPSSGAAIPRRTLAFYSLPSLSYSVAALPLALFVPAFYADDLGLPLAQVGLAIAASIALALKRPQAASARRQYAWPARFATRRNWLTAATRLAHR